MFVIKNVVFIDVWLSIVDSKEWFGDWEIDIVLGKYGIGVMVIILECKIWFYVVKKVLFKLVDDVIKVIIELFMFYKEYVYIIMVDNGREFVGYEIIVKELEVDVYFVYFYSFWECGVNENVNGFLR